MLKWAVSKRAEPIVHFTAVLDKPRDPTISPRQSLVHEIREHRRKAELTKRYRNRNKENHIIASPHPISRSRIITTTSTPYINQSSALRDVSNTTPKRNSLSGPINTTPFRKRNLPLSPIEQRRGPINTTPFRKRTLPLSPVEQRRCPPLAHVATESTPRKPTAPQSGAAIAMRGLTVPDTYFGSARYMHDAEQPSPAKLRKVAVTPLSKKLAQLRFSKVSIQRNAMFNNNLDEEDDMIDMSSKSLDSTDLNVMIDEILHSTRKVKPIPRVPVCTVPPAPHATPNSTIVSDVFAAGMLMPIDELLDLACMEDASAVVEREVRTPVKVLDTSLQAEECQLRRQGGVRRKHGRLNRLVERQESEQTRKINQMMHEHPYLRQSIELLACMDTPKQCRRG